MPRFSVIVPVYNVETFVGDALNSVKQQTFSDFECIVVNDGSTDGSLERIRKVTSGDARFRIISIQNSGLSEARNTGIRSAVGELIYYMDSDDIVANNFLDTVDKVFRKYKIDTLSFNYQEVEESFTANNHFMNDSEFHVQIVDARSGLKDLLAGKIHQMAWSYVTRTSLVKKNDLFFTKGVLFEDNNFAVKLLVVSNQIGIIHFMNPPYYLRQRTGSITDAAYRKKHKKNSLMKYLSFPMHFEIVTRFFLKPLKVGFSKKEFIFITNIVRIWGIQTQD
ncbi:Eps7F [Lacticaseibacillus paracasei subsp. paracasei Lpp228]|nr:Eps7F [Lacticaseibacillus paracasei subsp. paracasei Lpp228]